ncbi:protein of unknown function [Rhodovastum atsumiense]|nr:protein of unknown function [Rhodovastum atsumiense]
MPEKVKHWTRAMVIARPAWHIDTILELVNHCRAVRMGLGREVDQGGLVAIARMQAGQPCRGKDRALA